MPDLNYLHYATLNIILDAGSKAFCGTFHFNFGLSVGFGLPLTPSPTAIIGREYWKSETERKQHGRLHEINHMKAIVGDL